MRQRGFTLIEILITIAVTAVIIGAIAAMASNASLRSDNVVAGQQILRIQESIRISTFAQSYLGITSNELYTRFPPEVRTGTAPTGRLVNGSTIVAAPLSHSTFTLTVDRLPRASCEQLIQSISARFFGVRRLADGGNPELVLVTAEDQPLNITALNTTCTSVDATRPWVNIRFDSL